MTNIKNFQYSSINFCAIIEGGQIAIIVMRVVKGWSRSRFTENKTVLSQFTKNKGTMKITAQGE